MKYLFLILLVSINANAAPNLSKMDDEERDNYLQQEQSTQELIEQQKIDAKQKQNNQKTTNNQEYQQ